MSINCRSIHGHPLWHFVPGKVKKWLQLRWVRRETLRKSLRRSLADPGRNLGQLICDTQMPVQFFGRSRDRWVGPFVESGNRATSVPDIIGPGTMARSQHQSVPDNAFVHPACPWVMRTPVGFLLRISAPWTVSGRKTMPSLTSMRQISLKVSSKGGPSSRTSLPGEGRHLKVGAGGHIEPQVE